MTITEYFEKRLRAPLRNPMWSWGAQAADGTIYLRVWKDRSELIEGVRWYEILRNDADYPGDYEPGSGYSERQQHIAAVRKGAPLFLVVLEAKDVKQRPRKISGWNKNNLVIGGEIAERYGGQWVAGSGVILAPDSK